MNKKMEFICACKAFIARFRGKLSGNFEKKAIVIDNRKVFGARFKDCQIWYGGGNVDIENANFESCTFHLFGVANGTLRYLKELDGVAPDLIANTFPGAVAYIRKQSLA